MLKKNGGPAYTRLRPLGGSASGTADDDEADSMRGSSSYTDLENGRAHGDGARATGVCEDIGTIYKPTDNLDGVSAQAARVGRRRWNSNSSSSSSSSSSRRRQILQLLGGAALVFALACWLHPPIPYWLGLAERYRPRSPIGAAASSDQPPSSSSPTASSGTTPPPPPPPPIAGARLVPPPPRYEVTEDEGRAYKLWTNSTSSSSNVGDQTPLSWIHYQAQLDNFLTHALSSAPMLADLRQTLHTRFFLSSEKTEPIPSLIWATAKRSSDFEHASSRSFALMNNNNNNKSSSAAGAVAAALAAEHWEEHLLADPEPSEWALKTFGPGSGLETSWKTLDRGVMRADVWRYAILAFQGGLYSDLDTTSLKPVREWTSPEKVTVWDVGAPPELRDGPPQLIVGLEADTLGVRGWDQFWPRPIQVVQWTLAGARGHPVLLDVLRRIHITLQHVEQFRSYSTDRTRRMIRNGTDSSPPPPPPPTIPPPDANRRGWFWPSPPPPHSPPSTDSSRSGTVDVFDTAHGGLVSVVEATGPGVWTDSVFAYLETRYGVHWSQLHQLRGVVRIGEVAILPLTGLSPTDDEDGRRQRWARIGIRRGPMAEVGGVRDAFANVHHAFAGSWRKSGDTNA